MGFEQAPLSNLYESIVFFAWSILLIYLIFDLKYKQRAIGAFVIPFAFGGMIWAQWSLDATIQPLVPALQSNWLTYHVFTCFIGYAAFALACGVSIMYLIKVGKEEKSAEKSPVGGILGLFPSVKVLDDLNYKAIMVGFPDADARHHHRRGLGQLRLGHLLELGPERDLEPDRVVHLRRLPARPLHARLGRPARCLAVDLRLCRDDLLLPRRQPGSVRPALLRWQLTVYKRTSALFSNCSALNQ